jgi:hypothetical protein
MVECAASFDAFAGKVGEALHETSGRDNFDF